MPASDNLVRVLLENSHEGIALIDHRGCLRQVNQAFMNLSGLSRSDLVGHHVLRWLDQPGDDDLLEAIGEEIWQSGLWQGNINRILAHGAAFKVDLKINAILPHHDGAVRNYLVQARPEAVVQANAENNRSQSRDPLTGLPLRLLFEDRLQQSLSQASRHNVCVGAMFLELDADRLKLIRDSLGQTAADDMLREVAVRLDNCLRTSDSVARLSEVGFALLLSDLKDPLEAVRNASVVARKVYESLMHPLDVNGQPVELKAAMGITLFPQDGRTPSELLINAETALNHAKSRGWNNYEFFSAEMTETARKRFELETSLRLGIDRGELRLFYQPQVDLDSGEVIGAEALVRWMHPERGLVPPGDFIPVAEETGLIVPMGSWVLRTACKQIYEWGQMGLKPVRVGVNLSALQFKRQDLAAQVEGLLKEFSIDPSMLDLEITESAIMDDVDRAVAMLNRISALGVKLSIDDFGTGYSSLSQLRQFPFKTLKIDRSFVLDIDNNDGDAAIVSAIIAMAHSLNQSVIVEGLETEQQLNIMRGLHCNEMQGFLFSAPLPAEKFTELLQAGRRLES
ncbi:putative PAS/PAC sensor-containing diguanylate cyclase/phosphodiesterase [Magnetofaba australis IT-1]|uniref:Putative PAS/PAC sensor-containing diguanylate cyclase/phosphodiesterase n=2 Tax=Magnetofaba TaxID=1472292 RepID=A0A1Y2K578_9PROT|nr:putative PAS/PAC sensor-containing diguanylate cyclase/phosphodiesterase [Magnetofaba australis IT-1]